MGESKGSDCSKIKKQTKNSHKNVCCNYVTCWKCNEHWIVKDWSVSTLPVYFALKGAVGSFLFLVLRKHLGRMIFLPCQEITSMYRSWEMHFSVISTHIKVFDGKDNLCEIIERDFFLHTLPSFIVPKSFKTFLLVFCSISGN